MMQIKTNDSVILGQILNPTSKNYIPCSVNLPELLQNGRLFRSRNALAHI
jgi:hypothetical protein